MPDLLQHLIAASVRPVLITGALRDLVGLHLLAMGLEPGAVDVHAFTLAVDREGRYSGRIRSNPGVGAAKRRLVERLAATGAVTLAAGDSVSDLSLLRAARRQLIVGPSAPTLAQEFGATATTIESPATTSAADILDALS